jgi:2-aminoethylphosphonate-pyruvate transaminase
MSAFGGVEFDFCGCGIDYLVSSANQRILVEGMRELGFETYLPDCLQSHIITTFRNPDVRSFDFARFYDRLEQQGFVIYGGKVLHDATFRIGTIGRLFESDLRGLLAAIRRVLGEAEWKG